NSNEHSIRVCCWDGIKWHELESQIYDLEFKDSNHISRCGLVFLVPDIADGEEQYFVFYDDEEKPSPLYTDHVGIKDSYYYYEPISGISLEGDYYQITEDGFAVYAVGQKGQIINRRLSQAIIEMKPESKEFDVSNSENIASLSFGYNIGKKDEEQISSDYLLVSKEIRIDGNLMVECVIVSESEGKKIRTANIYRYYYCPGENNRISVHVKHQVFEEGLVTGQINTDGVFGGIVSYMSKSKSIKEMQFGKILPYLHVYGENNQIKEYNINPNPQNKDREWIIPYTDDCDIGEDAWFSYDEGESGKAFGILFSSNKDIVKYGKDERDGIQIKLAEKEYLDVIGAEIDYAAVSFGRNSYEKGGEHDLEIPDDLVIEFDVELFSTFEGGYIDVISEAEYFRSLVKYRQNTGNGHDNGDQNIYTLTVIPRFSARAFTYPLIERITGYPITDISAELYQNDEVVSKGILNKPLLGSYIIKFPKLASGDYIVKIFRHIVNQQKRIIGIGAVRIDSDKVIDMYCTWQKTIKVTAIDQFGGRIKDIELTLMKNDKTLIKKLTDESNDTTMYVNYNIVYPYILTAYYKGYIVYNNEIPRSVNEVKIDLNLYDLIIEVKDILGFSPGVNVRPILTSPEMQNPVELYSQDLNSGKYKFENLLASSYRLYISYGRFSDEKLIDVPAEEDYTCIKLSAAFNLKTRLLDSRGNFIENNDFKLDIKRNGYLLLESISPDEVIILPPARYTIKVYSDNKLIGVRNIELTNDKDINIVTEVESILPILITGIAIVIIIELLALLFIKRITLNTFLKLLAIALVIISLFQPWWFLDATNEANLTEKNSDMYIVPQQMVESIIYNDESYLQLATLPEVFTDFVGTLLFIIYSGIALLMLSFIPNILLKRRYFIILITASIVFLTLVALAFLFGMSKITEISLGNLNGQGSLDVLLPNGETTRMDAYWGLGLGFYLCIFSSIILIATGVIDFIRKKILSKKF
ncbi:hypothetical protein AYK24_06205, partial [Thermoplasmatales archaeon SG8-52-4]